MSKSTTEAKPASSFVDFLRRLEYGKLIDEADDALVNLLRELAKANERGAAPKGGITLKISLGLEEGVLHVVGDLAITKPRYKRNGTVLFASPEGAIIGEAPRQLKFFDPEGQVTEEAVVVAPASSAPAVAVAPVTTAAAPVSFAVETAVGVEPTAMPVSPEPSHLRAVR